MKKLRAFFVLLLIIGLAGCASTPAGKTYDALYAAAAIFDGAMTYAGDQYRAGKISEDQKEEIITYAEKYQLAWNTAQAALLTYKQAARASPDASPQQRALDIAMNAFTHAQRILGEYMALVANEGG